VILDKCKKEHFYEYVDICGKFVDIDKDNSYELSEVMIKHCKNNKEQRCLDFIELENVWYESFKTGNPDFSVYDNPLFVSDLWACWVMYSRDYLKRISSPKGILNSLEETIVSTRSIVEDMGEVNGVVDLGCGFGYTTAGLKEMFPNSDVYGTNIETSFQYKIATYFGKKYNFSIIPDCSHIGKKLDVVFASEYFEHIEDPIKHLLGILDTLNPKFLIIANAFNARALGHFDRYLFNGEYFDGKTISRMFNKTLRDKGYKKVQTNLWNDRPSYWKKV